MVWFHNYEQVQWFCENCGLAHGGRVVCVLVTVVAGTRWPFLAAILFDTFFTVGHVLVWEI